MIIIELIDVSDGDTVDTRNCILNTFLEAIVPALKKEREIENIETGKLTSTK